MTYAEIQQLIEGRSLPLSGKNNDGENVIVHTGNDHGRDFFLLIIAQHNGWIRRNYIYADGSAEEFYTR